MMIANKKGNSLNFELLYKLFFANTQVTIGDIQTEFIGLEKRINFFGLSNLMYL